MATSQPGGMLPNPSRFTAAPAATAVTGRDLRRFLGPDVSASDLAIKPGDRLGGVDLKVRVLEPRLDERFSVVVDRDRARDAARPGVQALLHGRVEGVELHHVGYGEEAARSQHSKGLFDDRALVLCEVDHAVGNHDIDRRIGKWDVLDRAFREGGVRY